MIFQTDPERRILRVLGTGFSLWMAGVLGCTTPFASVMPPPPHFAHVRVGSHWSPGREVRESVVPANAWLVQGPDSMGIRRANFKMNEWGLFIDVSRYLMSDRWYWYGFFINAHHYYGHYKFLLHPWDTVVREERWLDLGSSFGIHLPLWHMRSQGDGIFLALYTQPRISLSEKNGYQWRIFGWEQVVPEGVFAHGRVRVLGSVVPPMLSLEWAPVRWITLTFCARDLRDYWKVAEDLETIPPYVSSLWDLFAAWIEGEEQQFWVFPETSPYLYLFGLWVAFPP